MEEQKTNATDDTKFQEKLKELLAIAKKKKTSLKTMRLLLALQDVKT